ncbi:pancreatic lipase-related protein 2-like [Pelodytes ibericus]
MAWLNIYEHIRVTNKKGTKVPEHDGKARPSLLELVLCAILHVVDYLSYDAQRALSFQSIMGIVTFLLPAISPSCAALRAATSAILFYGPHISFAGRPCRKEVCYQPLGCFSDEKPYSGTSQRYQAALPWTPAKIGTRLFLYTQKNPSRYQVISAYDPKAITTSFFQTTRKTYMIIHGMADRAENNWVSNMCAEIIGVEDINCIGVDWHSGSGNIHNYVQAANNLRVVGAEVAYFVKTIQEQINGSYGASNYHLIGHSLGAHGAGEAGKRCPGIGRITGLDPAHLYFENTPHEVRLDATDAFFVDVIHTDINSPLGLGIRNPIGHHDIYPNGGKHMPGCPSKISAVSNLNALIDTLACNHLRAIAYYTASIRHPGGFLAFPCDSHTAFQSGSCFPCPNAGCHLMGHFSNSSHDITNKHQTLYLNTGADLSNLSSWRYKVSVTLRGLNAIRGKIYLTIHTTDRYVEQYEALDDRFFPGNAYSSFLDVGFELETITRVSFKWTPILFNLFKHQLGAEKIQVQRGKDGSISSFCTDGTVRENVIQSLSPC